MVSLIEVTGNISQLLFTIASGFRKLLYLRFAFVSAAILETIYYLLVADKPIWTPILWNFAIIFLNFYQILRLIYDKKRLQFSKEELEVYHLIGTNMNKLSFKKLMTVGNWINNDDKLGLLQENDKNDKLYFLVNGEAEVTIHSRIVSTIFKGNFIGEMSFLTGSKASASVSLSPNSKIIYWDSIQLGLLMEKDSLLKQEINNLLSNDLVSKIIKNNNRMKDV